MFPKLYEYVKEAVSYNPGCTSQFVQRYISRIWPFPGLQNLAIARAIRVRHALKEHAVNRGVFWKHSWYVKIGSSRRPGSPKA